MTTRLQTFPPHVHLSRPRAVSPNTALSHIQTYLQTSETIPHLHPDCLFTESGPQTSNASGGGVILHQLRRVEQGLRGIVLKPEDVEGFDNEAAATAAAYAQSAAPEFLPESNDAALDARIAAQKETSQAMGAEMEDDGTAMLDGAPIENYQEQMRAQGLGVVEGEIGDRTNVVGAGPYIDNPTVQPTVSPTKKRKHEQVVAGEPLDKEARKRAKKERLMAERRRQNEAQQVQAQRRAQGEPVAPVTRVDDAMELDETRVLHDEAEASSTFLPQKISETQVEGQPADQDEAKEEAAERKRKRKNRNSEINMPPPAPSDVSIDYAMPLEGNPLRLSKSRSNDADAAKSRSARSPTPAEPASRKEKKRKREKDSAPTINGVHSHPPEPRHSTPPRSETQVKDSQSQPQTNGLNHITVPETPQLERVSSYPRKAISGDDDLQALVQEQDKERLAKERAERKREKKEKKAKKAELKQRARSVSSEL